MTTHRISHRSTRRHDYVRAIPDPLRSDQLQCDCGAIADRDGRCRKCQARARWDHRAAARRVHADHPVTRRRQCARASSRGDA